MARCSRQVSGYYRIVVCNRDDDKEIAGNALFS
jgi:hypothetical protein